MLRNIRMTSLTTLKAIHPLLVRRHTTRLPSDFKFVDANKRTTSVVGCGVVQPPHNMNR
jgi:hypothetical protein